MGKMPNIGVYKREIFMKKVKNLLKDIWNDESGQGATEYILLIVVVIAAVAAFRQPILDALDDKMDDVRAGMEAIQ